MVNRMTLITYMKRYIRAVLLTVKSITQCFSFERAVPFLTINYW